ncbi:MAG: DUF2339 domain-containing protein [Candidatus Sericytochromatia bacterium]
MFLESVKADPGNQPSQTGQKLAEDLRTWFFGSAANKGKAGIRPGGSAAQPEDLAPKVAWLLEQNSRLEKRVWALEQKLVQNMSQATAQTPALEVEILTMADPVSAVSEPMIVVAEVLATPLVGDVVGEVVGNAVLDSAAALVDELGPVDLVSQLPDGIEVNAAREPEKVRQAVSLEEDIGLKWFSRIGIVALVMGIGLLIRFAFVNNWIGYFPRIALGVGFGAALAIGGHYVTRWERYVHWGRTLIGGGFAMMYFVIYAAYHFEAYRQAIGISQMADMALLTLVVLGAIGMALLHNSKVIVSGAFFLGYATAALSGQFESLTLVYGLILTLGLAALVGIRQWAGLGMLGLNVAYVFYAICLHHQLDQPLLSGLVLLFHFAIYTRLAHTFHTPPAPLTLASLNLIWCFGLGIDLAFSIHSPDTLLRIAAIAFLAAFFGLFTWQVFQFSTADQPAHKENVGTLALLHGALLLVLSFYLVGQFYPGLFGVPAFVLAVIYLGLMQLAKSRQQPYLSQSYLYLSIAALTAAIPLQFSGETITLIWVAESVILTICSYKLKVKALRYSQYAINGLAGGKLLILDLAMGLLAGKVLGPMEVFVYGFTLGTFYLLGLYLNKNRELLEKYEQPFPGLYIGAATVGSLMLSFVCLSGYVMTLSWILLLGALIGLMARDLSFEALRRTVYGVALLVIFKAMSFDLAGFGVPADGQWMFRTLNYLILIGLFHGLAIYLEKIYPQHPAQLSASEMKLPGLYAWIGTLFLAVFVTLQLSSYWISIGWAFAALLLLVPGFVFNRKAFRLHGMALLAVAIAKVFLLDMASLEPLYKTLSFIILGLILLGVAFIYSRYRDKLREIF